MLRRPLTAIVALVLAIGAFAAPVAAASPFPSRIDLPSGWMPEGITAGRGNTIYVGSLAGGGVWKGDVRTGRGDVLVPAWGGAATGVEYEAGANRLWVAGGPTGTVRVYDATRGTLLRQYTFSPAGFLNDLVVTHDAVYVTDSFNAWLDVIPLGRHGRLPDAGDVTTLPLTGIEFEAGQFNANGIVAARGWLIVVDSFTGGLFRVNRATGVATPISTGGVERRQRRRPGAPWQHAVRRAQRQRHRCRRGRGLPAGPPADIRPPTGRAHLGGPQRADDRRAPGRSAVGGQRPVRHHDDRVLGHRAAHQVLADVGTVPTVPAPGTPADESDAGSSSPGRVSTEAVRDHRACRRRTPTRTTAATIRIRPTGGTMSTGRLGSPWAVSVGGAVSSGLTPPIGESTTTTIRNPPD